MNNLGTNCYINIMPTGEWCKGKTKKTDPRVTQMAINVSKALRDPKLRKRLDEKKKLPLEEVLRRVQESKTTWKITSNISTCYDKLTTKNIECICSICEHKATLSIKDIIANSRCTNCHPKKRMGKRNHAYVDNKTFVNRLFEKFGDRFLHSVEEYGGLHKAITFTCNACGTSMFKQPRALLQEKHGCPTCAKLAKSTCQMRTEAEFFNGAKNVHGERYTFHPKHNQTYGNTDTITRTCNVCSATLEQSIPSLLSGNGCQVCSQKIKHTTETFIEKSILIYKNIEFDYSQVTYVNNKTPITLTCKNGHTFKTTPSNHFSGRGCFMCNRKRAISIGETEWLDALNIPQNCRNVWIKIKDQRYNVDAFINETIYEYYGDFWHGNPKKFNPDQINPRTKLKMGEHYENTIERERELRSAGYVVIVMWEFDWIKLRKTRRRQ